MSGVEGHEGEMARHGSVAEAQPLASFLMRPILMLATPVL